LITLYFSDKDDNPLKAIHMARIQGPTERLSETW